MTSALNASARAVAALALMVVALAGAWGFQLIGGFQPCPLCLEQRLGYYLAIPLALVGIALRPRAPALGRALLGLAGLAILWSAGLGIYHAGAEWGFWPGPDTCAGGASADIFDNPGGLLGALEEETVVSCTAVQGRVLGLSFAGWNVMAAGLSGLLLLGSALSRRRTAR